MSGSHLPVAIPPYALPVAWEFVMGNAEFQGSVSLSAASPLPSDGSTVGPVFHLPLENAHAPTLSHPLQLAHLGRVEGFHVVLHVSKQVHETVAPWLSDSKMPNLHLSLEPNPASPVMRGARKGSGHFVLLPHPPDAAPSEIDALMDTWAQNVPKKNILALACSSPLENVILPLGTDSVLLNDSVQAQQRWEQAQRQELEASKPTLTIGAGREKRQEHASTMEAWQQNATQFERQCELDRQAAKRLAEQENVLLPKLRAFGLKVHRSGAVWNECFHFLKAFQGQNSHQERFFIAQGAQIPIEQAFIDDLLSFKTTIRRVYFLRG